MSKTCEKCPVCGSLIVVTRTFTVTASRDEEHKGRKINFVRHQRIVCTKCGAAGDRSAYYTEINWIQ